VDAMNDTDGAVGSPKSKTKENVKHASRGMSRPNSATEKNIDIDKGDIDPALLCCINSGASGLC